MICIRWENYVEKSTEMDEYRELISVLPLETVEYAFAYGSGWFLKVHTENLEGPGAIHEFFQTQLKKS